MRIFGLYITTAARQDEIDRAFDAKFEMSLNGNERLSRRLQRAGLMVSNLVAALWAAKRTGFMPAQPGDIRFREQDVHGFREVHEYVLGNRVSLESTLTATGPSKSWDRLTQEIGVGVGFRGLHWIVTSMKAERDLIRYGRGGHHDEFMQGASTYTVTMVAVADPSSTGPDFQGHVV